MARWDNMLQRLYPKHKCIKMHVHNFTPDSKTFVFATKYKPNVKISCCNNGSNENRQKTWKKKANGQSKMVWSFKITQLQTFKKSQIRSLLNRMTDLNFSKDSSRMLYFFFYSDIP